MQVCYYWNAHTLVSLYTGGILDPCYEPIPRPTSSGHWMMEWCNILCNKISTCRFPIGYNPIELDDVGMFELSHDGCFLKKLDPGIRLHWWWVKHLDGNLASSFAAIPHANMYSSKLATTQQGCNALVKILTYHWPAFLQGNCKVTRSLLDVRSWNSF